MSTSRVTSISEADKRSYVSELRDSQAGQTRRQIVAAAGKLFAAQGFAATTIDAIAAAAAVSRKTVFSSVGGKTALLKLAFDYAQAGDDEPISMVARSEMLQVIAEPDPYEQMRLYAELITGVGERTSALWVALRGAAEVDPEARELFRRWSQEHLDGMRDGPVPVLRAKGVLRPGLSDEEAAGVFAMLIDPALYHRFVVGYGWSRDRFRDWLYEAILSLVLVPRSAGMPARDPDPA